MYAKTDDWSFWNIAILYENAKITKTTYFTAYDNLNQKDLFILYIEKVFKFLSHYIFSFYSHFWKNGKLKFMSFKCLKRLLHCFSCAVFSYHQSILCLFLSKFYLPMKYFWQVSYIICQVIIYTQSFTL